MPELTEEAALEKLRAFREPQKEEASNEKDEAQNAAAQNAKEDAKEDVLVEPSEDAQEIKDVTAPVEDAQDDAPAIELDAEQLAHVLGLESDYIRVDDSGKIKLRTKVDGQEGDATLQDLIKSYQIDAHLTNKGKHLQQLEEQRKRELSEFVNKTQSFAQQTAKTMEILKEMFIQPISEVDMKALRESDPAEYAARREEQRDREAKFSSVAVNALRQIEEAQKGQNEEMQRQFHGYLQEQRSILERNIPSISAESKNIVAYAEKMGFTEQEVNQIADARIITALYKAMQFDKGASGIKAKLSKPLPKVLKPSARVGKAQVALEELNTKRQALRKSGSESDALALLKSMRK